MKRVVLSCFGLLLLTTSIPAIVDINANGISDIWERQYNNGQPFNPPIDPAADPDSDGWTNAQEATAGTDPFDAKPPFGYLRPDIINIPAVWGANNGNPVLITPATLRVAWQTIPGKQYTLLFSPDLTPESWLPVEEAYIGNGTITEYYSPLSQPTRNFWRVKMEDADLDIDAVTNAEEIALGLNPNKPQSISGINDVWFAENFTDILLNGGLNTINLNADPDADGASTLEEYQNDTGPNSADAEGSRKWVTVQGNGEAQEKITRTGTLTIPAGQSAVLVVAIASEEFPKYTGEQSVYNDLLEWHVTPSQGTAINDSISVNERHSEWEADLSEGTTLPGLPSPVHIEQTRGLTAPPDSDLTIEVEVGATNYSDGSLPSLVSVGLLPVEVREVSFGGTKYWELKSDDAATTYSAPQWKDVDGNGNPTNTAQGEHDYAVAFTRNTKPVIGAKLKIASASSLGTINIKATGSGGVTIPETAATVSGDDVMLPLTEASSALVNTIKFYDKKDDAKVFKLEWEIKVGDGNWAKVATTSHQVYLTLADPLTTLRQETLFEIGSRRADGETEAAQARTKAYAEFQTRAIKRVSDQTPLKYWANPPVVGGVTTTELLAHPNGDGNCNGWSQFFRDTLRVQGIEANMVVVIPIIVETIPFLTPNGAKIVAVKEWTFIGEGTGTADYPYIADVDAIPGSGGTAGQNNPSPPKLFNLHYVTLSGATIYDSSYGTSPVETTIKAYEDAAFAGVGKKAIHENVIRSLIAVNHDGVISPAEVQILEVSNE